MIRLLWLIPALPLAGFLLLALLGRGWSERVIAIIGAGSVGLAALVAALVGFDFISAPPGATFRQTLGGWIDIAGFTPPFGLYLDALSLVMLLVVTIVGFLIHLYSTELMSGDEGYRRFFAYMNLFVAAMCVLVLGDNLLFLYLGWEGVGLCSYLLIGYWYREAANGLAARKAFVVTRVGDTAFTIALLLLFSQLGTLDIQTLMQRAPAQWPAGSGVALAAALLLLGGAVGKSAQLPLQTWLPDAMAGPTPVSALIHAATMVTAGVYLIARTHVLFSIAPAVQTTVGTIGAITLLLAGFGALAQNDIKRVLAYSTMSQIGYMFLALGVGAWSAAIFHLMTHAFFKALLFLSAGALVMSLHDEHDITRMGGLRARLPVAFWSFLIGGASLAALPLITAGFYSKDLILWQAWSLPRGSPVLWAAGWVGALLTGAYIFRVVFIAFFGATRIEPGARRPGFRMTVPLIVLSVLALIGGFVELPPILGNVHWFLTFLHPVLPSPSEVQAGESSELAMETLAAAASLGGIYAAYVFFLRNASWSERIAQTPVGAALRALWHGGWGFDALYDRLFVRPYVHAARVNHGDFIDTIYGGIAALCRSLYRALSRTQDGLLRHYAVAVAAGAVLIVAVTLLLW
jgi:NADH-quinone oxidoreductase subunit L